MLDSVDDAKCNLLVFYFPKKKIIIMCRTWEEYHPRKYFIRNPHSKLKFHGVMVDGITPHNKEILSLCMRFIDFEKKKILDINL